MFHLAGLFLILSGIATLTYQVVWVQLLSLSVGSTSASVSTVLAAFFLGMGLGSLLAERLTRRFGDHLRAYVVLEIVIGAAGLALLPVLLSLDEIMAMVPVWLGTSLVFKLCVSLALLVVPTMAMGATFPVMASLLIREDARLGDRLGMLYALNTAGAVLGAALSGFVLIPNLGMHGAVFVAVGLNAVVVVLGWQRRNRSFSVPSGSSAPASTRAAHGSVRVAALVVLAGTGFVSIAAEVAYTKALAIFLGGTTYGFATILSVFLLGIAGGSWAIKSRLDGIERPAAWLAVGLLVLGASLLFTRTGFVALPWAHASTGGATPSSAHDALRVLVVLGVLLPATFMFGALFPLSLRLYCGHAGALRSDVGAAYAVNTLASIAGALVGGFVLIPSLGTERTLWWLAIGVLALPTALVPQLTARMRTVSAGVAATLVAVALVLPGLDYRVLITAVLDDPKNPGEFLFLEEGKAGVISVVGFRDNYVAIQNNGLRESARRIGDLAHGPAIEKLLALLPYLLHDDPESAFCVGFGGGVTARALTQTELEHIRVVELEPAVVRGIQSVLGELDSLRDPRVELTFNDARNTLLVEDRRYDLIVSQPSHPWVAGSGKLFTREFAALVRKQLEPGGVFCQWCNIVRMDTATLCSIMKAFFLEFEHGFVCLNLMTGDVLLVGSTSPVQFDRDKIRSRLRGRTAEELERIGITRVSHLLELVWLSRRQALALSVDQPANSDLLLISEMRPVTLTKASGAERVRWLQSVYEADLEPVLPPADAGEMIFAVGDQLARKGDFARAERCAKRLRAVDPQRARRLRNVIANQKKKRQ